MPLGLLDKGREKTTLVFDTWADVGEGLIIIHWDCELSTDETTLLGRLASNLSYLGRSESWVEAELIHGVNESDINFNVYCHYSGQHPGPGWEQITLLAPVAPGEFLAWRERKVEAALESFPLPSGKKKPTKKLLGERQRAVEPYPEDLIACLTRDTAWWKKLRWAQPPGSQSLLYWRQANLLEVAPASRRKLLPTRRVRTILLALATHSGSKSALPSVKRTLPQAELIHADLVRIAASGHRVDCPELTGHDHAGRPLRLRHEHAHILPIDLDGDGHLDHVLIHAPMGLGRDALNAIRSMRRTYTKGGVGELQVSVAGVGEAAQLLAISSPYREAVSRLLGQMGPTGEPIANFRSVTPFVPPRFVKRNGKNTLEGQIQAELLSRALPKARRVTILHEESKAFRHFVRVRGRGDNPPQPPVEVGFSIEIELEQVPVIEKLPLALGYGSHFGLGLFAAGHSSAPTKSDAN